MTKRVFNKMKQKYHHYNDYFSQVIIYLNPISATSQIIYRDVYNIEFNKDSVSFVYPHHFLDNGIWRQHEEKKLVHRSCLQKITCS